MPSKTTFGTTSSITSTALNSIQDYSNVGFSAPTLINTWYMSSIATTAGVMYGAIDSSGNAASLIRTGIDTFYLDVSKYAVNNRTLTFAVYSQFFISAASGTTAQVAFKRYLDLTGITSFSPASVDSFTISDVQLTYGPGTTSTVSSTFTTSVSGHYMPVITVNSSETNAIGVVTQLYYYHV